MTRRRIEIICLVTLTLISLMSFSCGEVPQNGNVSRNRNAMADQNTNVGTGTPEADSDREKDPDLNPLKSACKGPFDEARRKLVEDEIKKAIAHYEHLRVKTEVIIMGQGNDAYLEVALEGTIRRRDRLNKLEHILHAVMKNECVRRVVFVRPNTIGVAVSGSRAADGFVWGCEHPLEMCDGECKPSCSR